MRKKRGPKKNTQRLEEETKEKATAARQHLSKRIKVEDSSPEPKQTPKKVVSKSRLSNTKILLPQFAPSFVSEGVTLRLQLQRGQLANRIVVCDDTVQSWKLSRFLDSPSHSFH